MRLIRGCRAVGEALGLNYRVAARLLDLGLIPAIRRGRVYFMPDGLVEQWLAARAIAEARQRARRERALTSVGPPGEGGGALPGLSAPVSPPGKKKRAKALNPRKLRPVDLRDPDLVEPR